MPLLRSLNRRLALTILWMLAGTWLGSGSEGSARGALAADVAGDALTLHLTGAFAAGSHSIRLAYFNDLDSAPLGSGTFQGVVSGSGIALSAAIKATPGVYRINAAVDGAPSGETVVYIPGVERNRGDLSIDGQPFSAFGWAWRDFDYIFKKEGGKFANINLLNLLRPVPAGGFGFNCVFTDDSWRLKPKDFDYVAQVGGHVCALTLIWAGLNPWGPADWNTGVQVDPIILSDGTKTKFGSFDSQHNRDTFVRDLKLFKGIYGSPPSLLGFYMFESTPDMPWDNRSLYSDYSPAAKDHFRHWLAGRYGSVAAFNAKRGAHLASFAEAEPPLSPDDVAAKGYDSGYWNDWIDFRYWSMADFLGWARSQIKALFGPDKMLIAIEGLTSSYASNDQNVTGANSQFAIDERLRARAADAIGVEGTYDYMPNHTRILRRAADFHGDGLPDIPILMDYYNYSWQPKEMYAEPADVPKLRFVDELGAGANGGLLEHTGNWLVRWEENAPHMTDDMLDGFRQIGQVNEVRSRFPMLFAQARTPHDISVVIPVWQLRYDPRYRKQARYGDHTEAAFQHALQRSQRAIQVLYADEPLPTPAGALMVPTGYRISLDFVQRLKNAVEGGANVYLEGAPTMDEEGHPIANPLEELTGATVEPETAGEFTSMDGAVLKCNEARKLSGVTGEVLARFADGGVAVERHQLGRGQVIYCPSLVGSAGAQAGWTNAIFEINFPEAYRTYYQKIAGMLNTPIASIFGAASPSDIRVHLLQTKNATLVLVTNWSPTAQGFTLRLNFTAGVAADLRVRKPLSLGGAGTGGSTLQVHLAGHDWVAIALSDSPEAMGEALKDPGASFALSAK